jgi:2-polyprenyl-6-methoxyphenol hydroxylase-like FAD-dependent oxidoreductase
MSPSADRDIVIAGAGPAGVAVAVALAARIGAERILCLDKALFPRDKPCGGGLTGHAHAALARLDLAVRVPRVACGRGRIVYRGRARGRARRSRGGTRQQGPSNGLFLEEFGLFIAPDGIFAPHRKSANAC